MENKTMKRILLLFSMPLALMGSMQATGATPSPIKQLSGAEEPQRWRNYAALMNIIKDEINEQYTILDSARAKVRPLITLWQEGKSKNLSEDWAQEFESYKKIWAFEATRNTNALIALRTEVQQNKYDSTFAHRRKELVRNIKTYTLLQQMSVTTDTISSDDAFDWACEIALQDTRQYEQKKYASVIKTIREQCRNIMSFLKIAETTEERLQFIKAQQKTWQILFNRTQQDHDDYLVWKALLLLSKNPHILDDAEAIEMAVTEIERLLYHASIISKAYDLIHHTSKHIQSQPADHQNAYINDYLRHWTASVEYYNNMKSDFDSDAYQLAANVLSKNRDVFKTGNISFERVQFEKENPEITELLSQVSNEETVQKMQTDFERLPFSMPSSQAPTPVFSGIVRPASKTITPPVNTESTPELYRSSPDDESISSVPTRSKTPVLPEMSKLPPSSAVRIVSAKIEKKQNK